MKTLIVRKCNRSDGGSIWPSDSSSGATKKETRASANLSGWDVTSHSCSTPASLDMEDVNMVEPIFWVGEHFRAN